MPSGFLKRSITISIHAPREGGDVFRRRRMYPATVISIHAPREGGDMMRADEPRMADISIHAPREGGDRFR